MILKEELKYSKSHEWIALDGDTAVVGLTDYAQSELEIWYLLTFRKWEIP